VAVTSREMEMVHGLEMGMIRRLSSNMPRTRRERRMSRYPYVLRFSGVYEMSVSGVSVSSSSEKRRKRKFDLNAEKEKVRLIKMYFFLV